MPTGEIDVQLQSLEVLNDVDTTALSGEGGGKKVRWSPSNSK